MTQILTESGFKDFSHIQSMGEKKTILFITTSGNLQCTPDHSLMLNNGEYFPAEFLEIGDVLYGEITILDIIECPIEEVFDVMNVSETHSYISNGIVSHNCTKIYVDEISFIPNNIAEEFLASVFPVISSGNTTKIFITSTPKGLNVFYKMWIEAEAGRNGFIPIRITWQENPDRNEEWLEEQRKNLGEVKFNQEILTAFIGSSKTLISGSKLATVPFFEPIYTSGFLKMYEAPISGHAYACTVDTSRGQHLDYSAFIIFDITTTPYKVVATFKDNTIGLMSYPFMIMNTVRQYNDAYCLIEINDAGQEIANEIFYGQEYENVYFTFKEALTEGNGYPGIRTTKRVKSIGCAVLKELIEGDQLLLNSFDVIQELNVFEQKGTSYAAADNMINDDLTTCLWLFAYLTKSPFFADITNINIRQILSEKNQKYIIENMTPFGFISDGREDFIEHLDINTLPTQSKDPLRDWMEGLGPTGLVS